jgi:hypothetical protein
MFSSADNKQYLHISATTTGLKSEHSSAFRNKEVTKVQTTHTHSLSCTITMMQCLGIGGMPYTMQL